MEQNEILAREIHAAIVSRSEWWRTNPTDPAGINTPVYVAMLEVANAINDVLVFRNLNNNLTSQPHTLSARLKEPREMARAAVEPPSKQAKRRGEYGESSHHRD